MTMVGLTLVCAAIWLRLFPELIGGMISGTSMGGGSAIGGIGMAAGAAGAAAARSQPSPRSVPAAPAAAGTP